MKWTIMPYGRKVLHHLSLLYDQYGGSPNLSYHDSQDEEE